MAEVVLRNITKVFPGAVVAVRNLNLHIRDRELLVLVGPSGCGKSTTLRMVAGLDEVTEGEIEIGGRVVNHVPPKDRDIAMVFQNYALYPHMSAYRNMAFGLKLRGFSKDAIQERVEEAARVLGISDLLERKPKQLSGGQRQRVAVGRAIVRKPQVFLFDEPLSNLDAKLRVEMRAELKRLHQRLETTMIYVTHDQVEAMTLGDRVVVMDKGEIQQAAGPLEVYDMPRNRFVAGFVGTPPMNFVDGRIEKRNGDLWFADASMSLRFVSRVNARLERAVGERVTLGFRPESVREKVNGAAAPDGASFDATASVIERLGDQTLVHLTAGQCELVGRLDAHSQVRPNEKVRMILDMDKVHVFDAGSGENLTYGAGTA